MGLANHFVNQNQLVISKESIPTTEEIQPTEQDILCGKDKRCQGHPGSRRFRTLMQSYQQKYQNANTKQLRMAITKEIYSICCRSNCRFLKMNEMTKQWEEISSLAARDKISHALRGNNPSSRGGSKKNDKKRRHRRNDSDSSFDSIYSEASTTTMMGDSSSSLDTDFSFLDDLMINSSLLFPETERCKTDDPLEPVPVEMGMDVSTVQEMNRDGFHHMIRNNSDGMSSGKRSMEPLPIDVTVDLSFLLKDSHIHIDL